MFSFGAGRRVCVGEQLTKNRLFLFITMLLQRFTFIAADEEVLPECDPRSYQMGIVLSPHSYRIKALTRLH